MCWVLPAWDAWDAWDAYPGVCRGLPRASDSAQPANAGSAEVADQHGDHSRSECLDERADGNAAGMFILAWGLPAVSGQCLLARLNLDGNTLWLRLMTASGVSR